MQRWEYQVVYFGFSGNSKLFTAKGAEKIKTGFSEEVHSSLERYLLEAGANGWELVNFAPWGNFGTSLAAVFKRPLP